METGAVIKPLTKFWKGILIFNPFSTSSEAGIVVVVSLGYFIIKFSLEYYSVLNLPFWIMKVRI